MNKRRWQTLSSIFFLAVVVVLGVWYVRGHADAFRRILEIDVWSFIWLSVLSCLALFLSGLQIRVLVRIFGVKLGNWEALGLSGVNTMGNFYFTKAGMVAKGVYLKHRHDFSYTHFLSTLAGGYTVSLVTFGAMGLVLYGWMQRGGTYRPEMLGILSALVVGGMLPLFLPRGRWLRRLLPTKVLRVVDGWEEVRRHRKSLVYLSLLNVLYVIVGGFRLFVSYKAVGYDVSVLPCTVISTMQAMTVIFTLTPGAVGLRQALVGYGSDLLDLGSTQGVVASTIDHGVGTLWVFVIGIVFSNYIWARRAKGRGGKEDES